MSSLVIVYHLLNAELRWRRSVSSLVEALGHAARHGLACEVLLVAHDRAGATPLPAERAAALLPCPTSVLRCSAEAGFRLSQVAPHVKSQRVLFLASDHLVSYNCLEALHAAALRSTANMVCPEAIYEVDRHAKVRDSRGLALGDFALGDPLRACLLMNTEVLKQAAAAETEAAGIAADYYAVMWKLVLQRLCAGDTLTAAPRAMLFARDLGTADRLPYGSAIGAPVLHLLAQRPASQPPVKGLDEGWPAQLLDEHYTRASIAAAHVDPAVDPRRAKIEPRRRDTRQASPSRFAQAAALIGQVARTWTGFDDVFLMDGLLIGGGQKYQLQVVESLLRQGLSRSVLIVCGEPVGKQPWISKVPAGATVLDLAAMTPELKEEERLDLMHRILCEWAPRARVHCKPIRFADTYLRRYAAQPSERKFIYYRWCDNVSTFGTVLYTEPSGPWHVDVFGRQIDTMLGDCQYILDKDTQRCGLGPLSSTVLPASIVPAAAPAYTGRQQFTRTLLWASRMERQKRASLLRHLGHELQRRYDGRVRLEVWGAPKDPADLDGWLGGVPCIDYKGAFQHFQDLDLSRYDALLYTSLFDGMPNIVLECLGSGLPVISEPVGGIPEVIEHGVTGLLVPLSHDDEVAARRHVDAIDAFYQSYDGAARMSEVAWTRLTAQRAQDGYDANLKTIIATLEQQRPRTMSHLTEDRQLRWDPSTAAASDAQSPARLDPLLEEQRLEILRLAEELSKARDLQIVHVVNTSNWARRAKKWKRSLSKLKHKLLRTA